MSALRTAAQQALEALEMARMNGEAGLHKYETLQIAKSAEALKAALAKPDPFNPDWDRIAPLQENLREHMAEIQKLRAQRDALLEALKEIQDWTARATARAASAKVEENKYE